MKVDLTQIPVQGSKKVKTGTGATTTSLKEGDGTKAQVLSVDKNVAIIKTEGGQTLRARLDSEVSLAPGDEVLLEVVDKDSGTITLSIRDESELLGQAQDQAETVQAETAQRFEDKTLLPYADKLAEYNMPVSEKTASLMRSLINIHPHMTLEEAAFIASNKLEGNGNLINAAINLLGSGEKMGSMIEQLMTLLTEKGSWGQLQNSEFGIRNSEQLQNSEFGIRNSELGINDPNAGELGVRNAEQLENLEFGIRNSELGTNNPSVGEFEIKDAGRVAVSEWLSLIDSGEIAAAQAHLRGDSEPTVATQTIISQSDINMQSRILENSAEMYNISTFNDENTVANAQNNPAARALTPESTDVPASQNLRPQSTGKAIAELLSGIDAFKNTPTPALEKFSSMLLRIAGDSTAAAEGDAGKITDLINKMFTQIEKNDNYAGARLKNAKEELFARLVFLEETISRSQLSEKTLLVDHTRKIMDHVRLLNSIDQFAYMQLPVQLGDDRKTAELYLFKNKNSKKTDPENVNILLSLDLENLGHWEGLVNFRNKDVSIRMEVAGEEEKVHFSENTVLLHELLAEAGFKLVGTEIKYSQKATTPLSALSVFDKLSAVRAGGIDYTI